MSELETYDLVRDLLVAMGFDRVAISHGSREHGRDLVFRERDRIGREIWRGVQVKTQAPTGSLRSANGLRAVLTQCEAALDTPYTTSSGDRVSLSEIWFLCTKPLTDTQKESAQGRLRGRVQVIDGSHLADLIGEYLPDLVRQRSGPLDGYLMGLIEVSGQANPYLSTKLGATISLSDLYLPPLSSLTLLRRDAIAHLNQRRLRIDGLFDVKALEEFADLAASGVLPALYHYRIFRATSTMLSLIGAASSFQGLYHADRKSISAPQNLAVALKIVLSAGPTYSHYFYCGELKREHLNSIASKLEKLDRPEFAPLRDYSSAAALANPPMSNLKLQDAERRREILLDKIVETYNSSIDENSNLISVIPEVARLLFERVGGAAGPRKDQERSRAIRAALVDAQRAWKGYATQFTASLVERVAAILANIESSIFSLSRGTGAGESELKVLAEARALTDLAVTYFDLPSGSIECREIDAQWLCGHAQFLVVEGDLGSGKTTLLRRVAAESARGFGSAKSSRIPLFCTLAQVSEAPERDLRERLLEAAHQGFGEGLPQGAPIRWFLDGFDEIRSAGLRTEIVAALRKGLLGGDVVLSSRPFALEERFPTGLQVTMLPFKWDQVTSFVERFPWQDARSPGAMLEILDRESDLRELAQSPLLLTLMCILAQARGASHLPTRRASIYHLVIDLLLTEWDLAKGVRRGRIVEDDSLRRVVLERTAFKLYEKGRRYFLKEEFVDLLISYYPLGPIPLDLGLMLFGDLVRDCILVSAGEGQFGFLHYSVHEYLAALDIVNNVGLARALFALEQFAHNGKWEEVLVFYAGIKRDIGPFLLAAHQHIDDRSDKPRREDLIRLFRRMLKAADFTRAETLGVRGAVAGIFATLKVGGRVDHWRQRELLK